jgi:hypothetical protein
MRRDDRIKMALIVGLGAEYGNSHAEGSGS